MYIPKHFEVTDREEILSFIEQNAFGQLISNVEQKLFSTHLPFLLSADKTRLFGHLALQNPQCADLAGQEVLVTFSGPHDYISPSWYKTPGVPTWNYQAVHVYGQLTPLTAPSEKRAIVDALTAKYESAFDVPWQADYRDTMLGAIMAFEISISELQCKYKLSQNRPVQDRLQVIDKLKASGSTDLAAAMARFSS